mmetsp:Transcript_27115/g.68094  ORF Transcript_27115/g.68094 Transcript_27115/m.68094 type:complete len:201 (-) Transcript_27115:929-1531(-)
MGWTNCTATCTPSQGGSRLIPQGWSEEKRISGHLPRRSSLLARRCPISTTLTTRNAGSTLWKASGLPLRAASRQTRKWWSHRASSTTPTCACHPLQAPPPPQNSHPSAAGKAWCWKRETGRAALSPFPLPIFAPRKDISCTRPSCASCPKGSLTRRGQTSLTWSKAPACCRRWRCWWRRTLKAWMTSTCSCVATRTAAFS